MSTEHLRGRTVDYARPLTAEEVARGAHRQRVGGKWNRLGKLQLDFMEEHGLKRKDRLLDVGCGALRGGRHFVRFLKPDCYYGIDINQSLLDVGYEQELDDKLRSKVPRNHLRATDRFDCDFGVPFQFAIAQSVFTHISLNQVRLCLYRLAKVMPPGGVFYATFFEAPEGHSLDEIIPSAYGKFTEKNPFFYYLSDLEWAAGSAPWKVTYIGNWGHPVDQRMVEFKRLEYPPPSTLRRIVREIPGARAAWRAVHR